jgi:hypothetical protein
VSHFGAHKTAVASVGGGLAVCLCRLGATEWTRMCKHTSASQRIGAVVPTWHCLKWGLDLGSLFWLAAAATAERPSPIDRIEDLAPSGAQARARPPPQSATTHLSRLATIKRPPNGHTTNARPATSIRATDLNGCRSSCLQPDLVELSQPLRAPLRMFTSQRAQLAPPCVLLASGRAESCALLAGSGGRVGSRGRLESTSDNRSLDASCFAPDARHAATAPNPGRPPPLR